jgi:alpha-D-ribose 1-methylphosphonate 5-triphosphate synthase subunit PhnG
MRHSRSQSAQNSGEPSVVLRQTSQRIIANSLLSDIEAVWGQTELPEPGADDVVLLRAPETGLMMVRAQAGGDGQSFNLGEMTVTRCSLTLHSDFVGHGYVAGRSRRHAVFCALGDALAQSAVQAGALQDDVLLPLARELDARQKADAEKAAATRVDFFTLVRGEDE